MDALEEVLEESAAKRVPEGAPGGFESRPRGLPPRGGGAKNWKSRALGRTTGGAEWTGTHLTRLLTPKGVGGYVFRVWVPKWAYGGPGGA